MFCANPDCDSNNYEHNKRYNDDDDDEQDVAKSKIDSPIELFSMESRFHLYAHLNLILFYSRHLSPH